MNTTLERSLLTGFATETRPPHLTLAITAGKEKDRITELVAELMANERLHLVAGGDWVPGYGLAHALRRKTFRVAQVLEQSSLARAFTSYQLLDLLAEAAPDSSPLVVLDFLHNFYDADIPYPVRFRVLKQCCRHLRMLSLHKPVAILVRQAQLDDYGRFLPFLVEIADVLLAPETPVADAWQPGLF